MIYLINFISLCARSENIEVTYEAVACVTKPTNEKKEIISEMVEIKAFLSNLNGLIIASIIRYKSYFPYAYYSLVENRMKKNINEWLHIDWVFGTFPCTHNNICSYGNCQTVMLNTVTFIYLSLSGSCAVRKPHRFQVWIAIRALW